MSDLIDRKAVLDKFNAMCEVCGEGEKYNGVMCRACALDDAIAFVEDMPSAETERKTGKWLPHPGDEDLDVCSVCGTGCKRRERGISQYIPWVTEYNYQFCPHCGADMRGE